MSTNLPLPDHHPDDDLPRNAPPDDRQAFVFRRDLDHQAMVDWLYDQGAEVGWFLGIRFTPEEATRRLDLFRARLTHAEQNDYVESLEELPEPEIEAKVRTEWAE